MSIRYQFLESKLPASFRQKDIAEIKKLIHQSTSFTVVGMPGMGISAFLKYLVCQNFAYFIHVDLYTLPKLDKESLFNLISRYDMQSLAKKHKRVVIVFNRFDQIKDEFDQSFFSNLRSLVEIDKQKIVLIFSANKPLYQWNPKAFERTNLDSFSKNFYLKPYSRDEMLELLKIYMPNLRLKQKLLEKYLSLSAGHFQLLQLLIKSDRTNNFLTDDFIVMQLKRIYEEYHNQKVKKEDNVFIPLLEEYIKHISQFNPAPLENKLLNLLEKNKGNVVTKQKIFDTLWPEKPDKQSDWALNALIYRLRKNPGFIQKGYLLKSHKKIGYSLA